MNRPQTEYQITPREHEILLMALDGDSNKQIAQELELAEVTVKKHLTSINRKLRVENRATLLRSFAPPGSAQRMER